MRHPVLMQHDVLLDALTALARARLDGDAAGVEAATAVLRWQPARPAARREPSVRVTAAVFARDAYHCRYCGRRVVLTAVLRLLSRLDPQRLPWHPNWKATATHPVFPLLSATLDHVDPVAGGGAHVDPGNLCCACWACNRRKGDLSLAELGWSLTPPVDPTWDGLSSSYRALWQAAGSPLLGETEMEWMRAVDPR